MDNEEFKALSERMGDDPSAEEIDTFLDAAQTKLLPGRVVDRHESDIKGHGWWESSFDWLTSQAEVVMALRTGEQLDIECSYCGELLSFYLKGESGLHVENDRCPLAHGVPDKYSTTLEIPSGKVVFANDLRHYFEQEHFDVNTDIGIRETFDHYGDQNMGHGFVGNSCPSIYRERDGFCIASPGMDEDGELIQDEPGGDVVGGITTDLWWYSIADYDDLVERGWEEDEWYHNVFEVEPGTYHLTHNARCRVPYDVKIIYALLIPDEFA